MTSPSAGAGTARQHRGTRCTARTILITLAASLFAVGATSTTRGGEPSILCTLSDSLNCQPMQFPRVAGTALASMGAGSNAAFVVADHFQTGDSGGVVSSLCWWGAYSGGCGSEPAPANDHFFVRILPRIASGPNAGCPDAANPLAVYEQGVNLAHSRRDICDINSRPCTEYSATLTPGLALSANTCYFLEIRNPVNGLGSPAGNWFWCHTAPNIDNSCYQDTTGNGYTLTEEQVGGAGDRAFCIGITLGCNCVTPIVCDDNDPCTTDTCVNNNCVYTPIPNCCTSNAQCNFPNGTCVNGLCQCADGYFGAY